MKKIISLLLALVMVMGLAVTAFADEATPSASITIQNAAKGESYSLYKVFGASVTGEENGSISYTGDIPKALESVFTKDTAGNISVVADTTDAAVFNALKQWAKTATAIKSMDGAGSALVFDKLEYGYYVVVSTQESGAAITVTSTNPSAEVYDKNSTAPTTPEKTVDKTHVSFGDTVTYTVTFNTANYHGADKDATKITAYTITDKREPEFLKNVTVTSIKVGDTTIDELVQFDAEGKLTIAWVDAEGNILYNNGAKVTITYTAVITDNAVIAGEGNKNEVELTWTAGANTHGGGDLYKDDAVVYTNAFVLKKVNQAGSNLAGATFQLPFYVREAAVGTYNYAGKTAAEGLVDTVTTPEDGVIVVKGVAANENGYSVTETVAPAGYNKLTAPVSVVVQESNATSTNSTTHLDKDGNIVNEAKPDGKTVTYTNATLSATVAVVVNKTGSTLPSTGGIGTTLFYVIGGLLMVGAVVVMVTKKRIS